MPPKKCKPRRSNVSRTRKCDEADNTLIPQAQQKPRRILPGPPKTSIDSNGTIAQVQEYSKHGYDGPIDFTKPIPRPAGYGPAFVTTVLPYLKPRAPAAGPNPAIKQEPFGPPPAIPLVGDHKCQRMQKAGDRVACVNRTKNVRLAVPSPGMMGPPSQPNRHDRSSEVPIFQDAELERACQESRQDQGHLQIMPPGVMADDSTLTMDDLDRAWMAMLDQSLFPNPGPSEDSYDRAVQGLETFLSPGAAPNPHLGPYNGAIDPALLPSVPEVAQGNNSAIPARTAQGFRTTSYDDLGFGFGAPQMPQTQQQRPQPAYQAQGTYLHQGGSHPQQPLTYTQPQSLAYSNGYPTQQQQLSYTPQYTTNYPSEQQKIPSYMPPYANSPPQQQQPAPQVSPGYPMTYAPPAQFNNVVGNNIMVNHAPSSQDPTHPFNVGQQNARRLRLEVERRWRREAEEKKGVFRAQPYKKR